MAGAVCECWNGGDEASFVGSPRESILAGE